MIAVCIAFVTIPACLLIIWFMSPLFKDIMESTVTGWGAAVGLSGFTLAIANAMPFLVPVFCFGVIIIGLIGLTRSRGSM